MGHRHPRRGEGRRGRVQGAREVRSGPEWPAGEEEETVDPEVQFRAAARGGPTRRPVPAFSIMCARPSPRPTRWMRRWRPGEGRGCKNKCGLGQPPGRIVIANVLPAVFHRGERSSRKPHSLECHAFDAHLRLAPQGYDSALPSSLEGGFSEEADKAWAPAHWTCAEFPPVIHSRENHRPTLNPCRNRFRTSHAFDLQALCGSGKINATAKCGCTV